MARPRYHRANASRLGYWRADKPGLEGIEILFQVSQRTTTNDRNYRFIIHGVPCTISPTWQERHPEEAATGEATYSYSRDKDTVAFAVEDAREVLEEEYPDIDELPFEAREELERVAFANLVMGADENNCWERVDWIDVVDTDSALVKAPPTKKPVSFKHTLTPAERYIPKNRSTGINRDKKDT